MHNFSEIHFKLGKLELSLLNLRQLLYFLSCMPIYDFRNYYSKFFLVLAAVLVAAWLAQLVRRQSAVREVSGSIPDRTNTQGLKIIEEKVLPLL